MVTKKVVAVLPKVHTVGTVLVIFYVGVAFYAIYAISVSLFSGTLDHIQLVGELFFGISLFCYALMGLIVSSDFTDLGLQPKLFFRPSPRPVKECAGRVRTYSVGIPVLPSILFFIFTFFVPDNTFVYLLYFLGIFVVEYVSLYFLFNHYKKYYKKFPELLF